MNAQRIVTTRLAVGSLVIERYVYGTRRGGEGVQWLVGVVDAAGEMNLLATCQTLEDAIGVLSARATAHIINEAAAQ